MRPALPLIALAAVITAPAPASAGESACWFEAGVLVVPAELLGVAGDYVLDTGAPHTLMADTPAQAAGFAETTLSGRLRIAGQMRDGVGVTVTPLDARFRKLATPVAGVIGADVLRAFVLDVSFAPCRVRLSTPRAAPRFPTEASLPLAWRDGRPTTPAHVADGDRTIGGDFVVATGSDTPVRFNPSSASAPGAAKPETLTPYGEARARLRALSFGGALFETLPAGLLPADTPPEVTGEIGAPVLAHWRLRFDFPRQRLEIRQAKGPPDRSDGP